MPNNSGRAAHRKAISRVHNVVSAMLGRIRLFKGDRITAAVSGGPDSVALVHALYQLRSRCGFTLLAAHFNHGSRGEESSREEEFVRQLCARLGVELHVGYGVDLRIGAANWEERAREQRHLFFCDAARRRAVRFIALGHHADDQAETVLMRLVRGSGMAGIGAMAEVGAQPFEPNSGRDGHAPAPQLIRPLLTLRREELLAYIEAIGAEYIVDSSNLSSVPMRNRIRHELIPALERDYPGVSGRLVGLADEMRGADDLLMRLARQELAPRLRTRAAEARDQVEELLLDGFERLHPALRPLLIREFVRKGVGTLRRFERAHIDAIVGLCLRGPSNGRLDLPMGWRVRRQYRTLLLERKGLEAAASQPRYALMLPRQGELRIPQAGFGFTSRITERNIARRPENNFTAICDADLVDDYLLVRSFAPGDRVRPLNLSGTRKIKDVFIERKLPLCERRRWPIVVSGGEVLWIPGILRSGLATVSSGTRNVLHLTATPLEQARMFRCLEFNRRASFESE